MAWAPPGGRWPGAARARTGPCSYQPDSPGRNQRGGAMRGLDGRTYVVTGASSGIGRATATRLLQEGARVMGADITEPPGDPGAADGGARWAFTRVDVTDEGSVEALV